MILRNVQCLLPVSDFHFFLESSSPSVTDKIFGGKDFGQFLSSEESLLSGLTTEGGSGLFLLANAMNHSCEPNVVVMTPFPDYRIKIVALRDIQQDEELTFSYIDESQSYSIRQKELTGKYLFQCECSKCKLEMNQ